ncbi:hypothetical protein FUA23_17220 [Neolewinella aurantiaca]|uniref:Uncharacterized protein n=1 Tax=Neolewinella aurantiaca TaxID=2602767 RepID=A0A5C7FE81_9BACT|nr:hypothetical protein [Neolewinella aurantiaca]TXF87799.1 hypothetical protein FUA23_17220 [Neolewinella aurantiaca]
MLSALKRDLKKLIAELRFMQFFDELAGKVLSADSKVYDQMIALRAQYRDLKSNEIEMTSSEEGRRLHLAELSRGALELVSLIGPADLGNTLKSRVAEFRAIPSYHALGVNRDVQAEKFELDDILSEGSGQKVFFYHLQGDTRQEMENFVKRLGLELGGPKLKASSLEVEGKGRVRFMVDCKPDPRGNKRLFKILLIKSLMEKFISPINNQSGLEQKTLLDLLPSPKLSPLTKDDAVFITVRIDHHNWNKLVVPEVLHDLHETFCKADLPEDAPSFYFFFGMEYPREKPTIKKEVSAAISNSKFGEALEELMPVSHDHVANWFTHHEVMLPPQTTADAFAPTIFPDGNTMDMIDVVAKLQQLIDQYNEGISLATKH